MRNEPKAWVYFRSTVRWIIGGIALFFYFLLVLIASLFVPPYKLDPLLKVFTRHITLLAGIKVRVHGLEKLDPRKTYLFLFNHINMFDHFVLYSSIPHCMRGVEKESHFRWPVYGTLLKKIGQVSIPPRGNTSRAIQSLERAKQLMADGVSIAMAPEGTRSKTGELQPFKKGAFHLAVDIGATIVPVILKGMYTFNRKGDWLIYPGPVDLYFEDPISTAGFTQKEVRQLSDQVREIIARRLQTDAE